MTADMTPPTRTDEQSMILQAINELKTILSGLDNRLRELERATVEQSAVASQKLDALFRRVDEHSNAIRGIENDLQCAIRDRQSVTDNIQTRLQRVEAVTGIAKWLGMTLGLMILGLLWAIFTGQVVIK